MVRAATQPPRRVLTPKIWLPYRELSRDFWIFFLAALLYEAGFGLYFFLFNLYLLDLHFDEKAIGIINGALSLGLLTTTLPVGMLSRKLGSRPVLLFCFVAAPLLGVLRVLWVWEPAQIGLACIAGLVMSIWTVCFLPVSASLTSESNRASAIGLIFSVGIGATAMGSGASGYLSHWISTLGLGADAAQEKRILLLLSCGVAALGSLPLLRLAKHTAHPTQRRIHFWDPGLLRDTFLRRYLPCMALWTSLLAAFLPFASVYFAHERHMDLPGIGIIFSVSQMAQLIAGLLIPGMVRRWGMQRSIFITQIGTALLLATLVAAAAPGWSVVAFVGYSATQWMSSTAIYTLLMNAMPEAERSAASAMTMFCNALGTTCATPALGALLVRLHYAPVLLTMAALEAALAILFRFWLSYRPGSLVTCPALPADVAMD